MALGLADYKKRKAEEDARREAAGKPKINRFALEKDGDSAIIRFAQEMDYDAKNFDKDRGIGFVNIEHTCGDDPKNGWRNRANCSTESQGACYGCDRVKDYAVEWAERKGWKQKEKFYINVIGGEPREVTKTENGKERKSYFATDVNRTDGDGVVYLLEQGTYNGIYDSLADYFLEEEVSGGTITDKFFKISRKGSGFNDTSYGITALKEIPAKAKDLGEFELIDINDKTLNEVPYPQQAAFYAKGTSAEGKAPEAAAPEDDKVSTPAKGGNDTW